MMCFPQAIVRPLMQVTVYNRMTLAQCNATSPASIQIHPPAVADFTMGCDFNVDDHRPKKQPTRPGSTMFGLAALLKHSTAKPKAKASAKASADGSTASHGQQDLGTDDRSCPADGSGSGSAPSSRSFFSMLTNLDLDNVT